MVESIRPGESHAFSSLLLNPPSGTFILEPSSFTMFPDFQVPNAERLHFRGLANNHHILLQNRLYHHPPSDPTPSSTPPKMSPTQLNHIHSNGGIKVIQPSEAAYSSFCGEGDLCDWGWNLSLHSTELPMGEWFSQTPPSGFLSPTEPPRLADSTQSSQPVISVKAATSPPESQTTKENGSPKPHRLQIPARAAAENQDELDKEENAAAEEDELLNNSQKDAKRLRSSSLKTIKTPPGTPGNKKIVRFADCLGLDLVDVKLFLDEIPNVPKSAFSDLQDAIDKREEEIIQKKNKANKLDRTLLPSFHQPIELGDFFDRVGSQKVLLETCYLVDHHQIKGCIRVRNLDFNKQVVLRYTYDDWQTCGEIQAIYVPGSCDGFSDRFEFDFTLDTNKTKIGSKFAFACKFECLGLEFWDNNCNRNYVFHCVPAN